MLLLVSQLFCSNEWLKLHSLSERVSSLAKASEGIDLDGNANKLALVHDREQKCLFSLACNIHKFDLYTTISYSPLAITLFCHDALPYNGCLLYGVMDSRHRIHDEERDAVVLGSVGGHKSFVVPLLGRHKTTPTREKAVAGVHWQSVDIMAAVLGWFTCCYKEQCKNTNLSISSDQSLAAPSPEFIAPLSQSRTACFTLPSPTFAERTCRDRMMLQPAREELRKNTSLCTPFYGASMILTGNGNRNKINHFWYSNC